MKIVSIIHFKQLRLRISFIEIVVPHFGRNSDIKYGLAVVNPDSSRVVT